MLNGFTAFDEYSKYFKENYDTLVADFVSQKQPSTLVDKDKRQEIENIHDAFVNELKLSFSQALNKDRLYHRPAGFLQEDQIWMMGVLSRYLVK